MMNKLTKFPDGFLWGAATASHQVEGGQSNDWTEWEKMNAERLAKDAKNYWQEWQQKKFPEMLTPNNYISGRSTDHYHLFESDFEMAKIIGHNITRFSIEWSRIEPQEGVFDEKEINHYKEVIAVLKKLEIKPMVTLWHWPIPIWLRNKGGWQCKKMPEYFSRYAEKIVNALGEDVQLWITLNEPEVYAGHSYLKGIWPPQKKSILAFWVVINNLIKTHRRVYKIIKTINKNAQVGIAKNNIYFEASDNKLINKLVKRISDSWWNFYFLNRIKKQQDFIGLNNYFHNRIDRGLNKNRNKIVSDLGWELYPEAIYYVLMDLKKYQKPIYITENGLADARDEKRPWFIIETLKNIGRAIDDGVDARGYLHWSLMDNFEWDKGYWPRFGLIEIDYQTLDRKIRPSALLYRDICVANGITEDIIKKYKDFR